MPYNHDNYRVRYAATMRERRLRKAETPEAKERLAVDLALHAEHMAAADAEFAARYPGVDLSLNTVHALVEELGQDAVLEMVAWRGQNRERHLRLVHVDFANRFGGDATACSNCGAHLEDGARVCGPCMNGWT